MTGTHSDGFRPPQGWAGGGAPEPEVPEQAARRQALPADDPDDATVPLSPDGEPGWRQAAVAAADSAATTGDPSRSQTSDAAADAATATAPRGRRARKAAAQPASQAPLNVTSAQPSDGATLISHDEDDGVADATMHHLARTAHQLTLTLIVVGSVAVLAILALVLSRTVDQFKPAPTLVTQTATVHVTATATPVTLATDGGFAANAVSDVRFGTVVLPASQTIVSSRWGPEQADTQLQSGTEILIGLLGSATPTPGAVTVAPSTAPAQAPATPTTTVNTYPYGIPTPASTLSAAARRWITTQDGATIDRGGSGMRTMTSGYTAWCARSSSQPDRTGEGCFYPTQGGISFIWVWTPPAVTDDIRATLLNSYVPGF